MPLPMPTVIRERDLDPSRRDGIPTYVDPRPHPMPRTKPGTAARSLLWYELHAIRGFSFGDLAAILGVPKTTLQRGVATVRRLLEGLDRDDLPDRVPVQPLLGAAPWPTETGQTNPLASGPCPLCGGAVRHDDLYCPRCQAVSPATARRVEVLGELLDLRKRRRATNAAEAKRRQEAADVQARERAKGEKTQATAEARTSRAAARRAARAERGKAGRVRKQRKGPKR
jgi:uncharacterized Zn finger protein (UPF0148 family)